MPQYWTTHWLDNIGYRPASCEARPVSSSIVLYIIIHEHMHTVYLNYPPISWVKKWNHVKPIDFLGELTECFDAEAVWSRLGRPNSHASTGERPWLLESVAAVRSLRPTERAQRSNLGTAPPGLRPSWRCEEVFQTVRASWYSWDHQLRYKLRMTMVEYLSNKLNPGRNHTHSQHAMVHSWAANLMPRLWTTAVRCRFMRFLLGSSVWLDLIAPVCRSISFVWSVFINCSQWVEGSKVYSCMIEIMIH